MVFFYTSVNVKMLRNILLDFSASEDITPYEYMQNYIEKFPEDTDNGKVQLIAETFLGIHKHLDFLKQIGIHMSEELNEEEQDYYIIYFYAVTFACSPSDVNYIYKSMFNLNKNVLRLFAQFLANGESLTFVSQVAELNYDSTYISNKIIEPLFQWQPYISEMEHSFEEYKQKINCRKIKPLTVPITPNVLSRKHYEQNTKPNVTVPPPNSVRQTRKMLTKNEIDQRLSQTYNHNKKKASWLLNEVTSKNFHFAEGKTDRYFQKIDKIKEELSKVTQPLPKPKKVFCGSVSAPVHTIASIKRINKSIQMSEEEEVKWLQNVLVSCRNTAGFEQLVEQNRINAENERIIDIERKHLLGKISHEEALLAKIKLQEENKKKYEEYMKERAIWNEEIEKWKEAEMEKNRKQIQSLCLQDLNLKQARNDMTLKKKEYANKTKKESDELIHQYIKEKNDELLRKINMIKQIKILSEISKKTKVPKIIDLTKTSGLGFLCEMSSAELQERLNILKISIKEETEIKRKQIKDENELAKKNLDIKKNEIENYMSERAEIRKINKDRMNKNKISMIAQTPKDIKDLKAALYEKRKLRQSLS